jgi:hypothetical protein
MTADLIEQLTSALAHPPAQPEDNPLHNHTETHLRHAGEYPAVNMANHGGMAWDMEAERIQGLADGKADRSTQRSRQARARAARKMKLDEVADAPVVPDTPRMTQAWIVVVHLEPIITKIANGKRQWASRFLGSTMDDIPQMVLEKTALILAKSDHDLDLLERAAAELADEVRDTNMIPRDQLTDDQRADRKAVYKARKWLMGVVNNRVMGALSDSYTDQRNLRWDNLDTIATVLASINGAGNDPLTATFKADRAPALIGAKFQTPGGIDAGVLAAAVNAAISEKRLDLMVEVMLDENNLRVDGAVRWTKCAQQIFLATPEIGAWAWDTVVAATAHLAQPERARGDAAREHARQEFAFLPRVIVDAAASFEVGPIDWFDRHAIMATGFDWYYQPDRHPEGEKRLPLQPSLTYDDADDAARAILSTLPILVTGEDLIESLVNA